jgi:hypothetical protein
MNELHTDANPALDLRGRLPAAARNALAPARSMATRLQRRFVQSLAVAAVLCAHAAVAHAVWTVDADGACVHEWASSDMLRGPLAIACAPLRPLRTTAGGVDYAWNQSEWGPWHTVLFGAAVTGISAAAGLMEGVWWIGTGLGDTLTGGYFELTPDAGLEFSLRPVVSPVLAGSPPPTEDRCGRPVATTK